MLTRPARYRIRVQGRLGPEWAASFTACRPMPSSLKTSPWVAWGAPVCWHSGRCSHPGHHCAQSGGRPVVAGDGRLDYHGAQFPRLGRADGHQHDHFWTQYGRRLFRGEFVGVERADSSGRWHSDHLQYAHGPPLAYDCRPQSVGTCLLIAWHRPR